MDSLPYFQKGVARDIVFLAAVGIHPVLIHGGGKAINRAMKKEGLKPRFVHGHRVSDEAAAKLADRVLSEDINPNIVKTIRRWGGKAIGIAGRDILKCQQKIFSTNKDQNYDLGFVGEVSDVQIDRIQEAMNRGITPVISPSARSAKGELFNCNADSVAAAIAISLKARRLVFMSDVPGVLRDASDSSTLIASLSISEMAKLKSKSAISSGMIPKLESAIGAIEAGVKKVSLVDGRLDHAVLLEIFTDKGVGTQIMP